MILCSFTDADRFISAFSAQMSRMMMSQPYVLSLPDHLGNLLIDNSTVIRVHKLMKGNPLMIEFMVRSAERVLPRLTARPSGQTDDTTTANKFLKYMLSQGNQELYEVRDLTAGVQRPSVADDYCLLGGLQVCRGRVPATAPLGSS